VRSSVSIALFFLLSGLFLSVLLGAIERSRKLLAIAGGCLVGVVCIIVFLTPVQLPNLGWWNNDDDGTVVVTTGSTTTVTGVYTGATVVDPATTSTAGATTTTLRFTITTSDMTVTTGGPGGGRF
jgi:hypothetical protein